ncbi:2,3-bisphosphoglycerate-dependent phosphoglycerate mutase [Cohnella sp. OV330]|uniref:histidine phosphatase family protein n=1 Tax=Cohnella sp. OV330 TaxID=1855288 RepID=UPI0008E34E17|nr:histidine phosphatase family protein [Cohnella sp. OV330]SFB61693.1 2,3-bisphosphoglycerate-dependent phosphoglycerate mutase [Cohnella sp. OV330]
MSSEVTIHTFIYLVRHAESPFIEGMERTRGLSGKGKADAAKIRSLLYKIGIDFFISSPYERAIQTIKPLADRCKKGIILMEDLRERQIGQFREFTFKDAKRKVYSDFSYAFTEGESSYDAQKRAINPIKQVLNQYAGKRIVLGTHGDIMTLILNHFNKEYDFEFWESTTMPDIYELMFDGTQIVQVARKWE